MTLFLHNSFTFMSLFFHTTLYHPEVFHHLSFLILVCLVSPNLSLPLDPEPASKVMWHLATHLQASSFSLCSHLVKNLQALYNFLDAHAILVVTFPSGMPFIQFLWPFCCVLFTTRDSCLSYFDILVTYAVCQTHSFIAEPYFFAETLKIFAPYYNFTTWLQF